MVEQKWVLTDELIDTRFEAAMRPGVLQQMSAIFQSINDPTVDPSPPLWARIHQLRHRLLITWGRDDRMIPFEAGLFAFQRLENAEMHLFAKCGHWAQAERKEEFERVVVEFLTRTESAS